MQFLYFYVYIKTRRALVGRFVKLIKEYRGGAKFYSGEKGLKCG